jgi:hypothetical protein
MINKLITKFKRYSNRLKLPLISCGEIISNENITIVEPIDSKPGGLTLEELAVVIGICKKEVSTKVFEFGSFRGRTTVNLMYNCNGLLSTTLDLPIELEDDKTLAYSLVKDDLKLLADKDRGYFFQKYSQFGERTKRLFGDSAVFDFSPYNNEYDLVFIDASHRYENVVQDTNNAIKLLKDKKGIILWHDYEENRPGVVKALHEFNELFKIYHIKRTKLAYAKFV